MFINMSVTQWTMMAGSLFQETFVDAFHAVETFIIGDTISVITQI